MSDVSSQSCKRETGVEEKTRNSEETVALGP